MKLELSNIHSGMVTRKIPLKKLLEMENPACTTKDGDEYHFDRKVLEMIGKHLPAHRHTELKLPVNVHFDMKVENQCYITDAVAAEVIRELENFGEAYRFRDGKMWIPESIALDIFRKYPTAFQRVVYPG
jgi:uncharacterized protein (UPF0216 family)